MTVATTRKGRKAVEKKNQTLERLHVEYVPAIQVRPNDYNPNRQDPHDFYLLVKSMLEDGFTQPIIVLRDSGQIVDGEHRWTGAIVTAAIRRDGIDADAKGAEQTIIEYRSRRGELLESMPDLEIPIVRVDMTPEQARISTLRHNRARGSEDIELTAALLRDLERLGARDWAQDSLLLSDDELERMLEDIPAPEAMAADAYADAWVPGARIEKDGTGGDAIEAYTPSALDARARAEREAQEAANDEDKQRIMRERDNFRVGFVFSGEEAKIVRSVLGDEPAVNLLAICSAIANTGTYTRG